MHLILPQELYFSSPISIRVSPAKSVLLYTVLKKAFVKHCFTLEIVLGFLFLIFNIFVVIQHFKNNLIK